MTANDRSLNDVRLERTTPLLAGCSTACDWLDRADRAIERYKRDPLSFDGIDAMFDAILALDGVSVPFSPKVAGTVPNVGVSSFKVCDGTEHVEDQLAGSRRDVDLLLEAPQTAHPYPLR